MKTQTQHTFWSILFAILLVAGSATLAMAQAIPGGSVDPIIHTGKGTQSIGLGGIKAFGNPGGSQAIGAREFKVRRNDTKEALIISSTFSPKKLNIASPSSTTETVNVRSGVYLGEFEFLPGKLCLDSSGVIILCPNQ